MKTAFLVAAVAVLSVASAHNDSFDKRCLRACPYDYRPVCASNGQDYTVFANECTLEAENCDAGYKHQHLWTKSPMRMCVVGYSTELHHPVACPEIYLPVCGFDGKTYKIFNNACLLKGQQYEDGHKWAQTRMDLCQHQTIRYGFDRDPYPKCNKPCPSEYNPICTNDYFYFVTFKNSCEMEIENCKSANRWHFYKMGKCTATRVNRS